MFDTDVQEWLCFSAKAPESPPLQQDGNLVVYVHRVHGGQLITRASRAPQGAYSGWAGHPAGHPGETWPRTSLPVQPATGTSHALGSPPTKIPAPKTLQKPSNRTAEKSALPLPKELCVLGGDKPSLFLSGCKDFWECKQCVTQDIDYLCGNPLCSRRWAKDPQSLGCFLLSRKTE